MPYRVIRGREITIPEYQDEAWTLNDVIPDKAFEVCPNRNLKKALLNMRWIEAEPGAEVDIDEKPRVDDWPRWVGGPWFLTEDGEKHRGKQKALAHMGMT